MTTTPELDAAMQAAAIAFLQSGNDFGVGIIAALRSLATPTPEVIEAIAKALTGPEFAPVPSEYHEARVMYAALWAHILGEAKAADLPPDLSTRGNRP